MCASQVENRYVKSVQVKDSAKVVPHSCVIGRPPDSPPPPAPAPAAKPLLKPPLKLPLLKSERLGLSWQYAWTVAKGEMPR